MDLSWTLSWKLCINPKSQFRINLYLCWLRCITPWTSASKINEWMIQLRAPSSGETREFIWRVTLTVHYGDSQAIECTSVVHLFLRCIVGLNECTREHPLWFRTPLRMAVPSNSALFAGIGGDFGYSHGLPLSHCDNDPGSHKDYRQWSWSPKGYLFRAEVQNVQINSLKLKKSKTRTASTKNSTNSSLQRRGWSYTCFTAIQSCPKCLYPSTALLLVTAILNTDVVYFGLPYHLAVWAQFVPVWTIVCVYGSPVLSSSLDSVRRSKTHACPRITLSLASVVPVCHCLNRACFMTTSQMNPHVSRLVRPVTVAICFIKYIFSFS